MKRKGDPFLVASGELIKVSAAWDELEVLRANLIVEYSSFIAQT